MFGLCLQKMQRGDDFVTHRVEEREGKALRLWMPKELLISAALYFFDFLCCFFLSLSLQIDGRGCMGTIQFRKKKED